MYKGKRLAALLMSLSLTATMLPAEALAAEAPQESADIATTAEKGTSGETEAVEAVTETTEEAAKDAEDIDTVGGVEDKYNSANPSLEYDGSSMTLTWSAVDGATSYGVYRAKSRYGNYEKIATVNETTYKDGAPNTDDKYENYYRIAVENELGEEVMSEAASLEIEMFGKDMYVFSPDDDPEQIYDAINDVYFVQGGIKGGIPSTDAQFGDGRYAFAFKTGDYSDMRAGNYDLGYYMQLIGLGKTPYDVKIKNVHVPAMITSSLKPNSGTTAAGIDENCCCNFWMGIENLSISAKAATDTDDHEYDFKWAVSQAAPARRLYVERSARLNSWWDGWASGGYIADSIFEEAVGSWSQQQYYLRNSELKKDFYGVNWNLVTQGCEIAQGPFLTKELAKNPMYDLKSGVGRSNWNNGGHYTFVKETDTVKEKPFLYFDEAVNEYKIFVPALRNNSEGVSWSKTNMGEGRSIDIKDVYIAKPSGDKTKGDAAKINEALAAGKHVILSPGIYYAEKPITITNPNTVFLGLGLATIIPMNNDTGVRIEDVEGVNFAGVIIDADDYSQNMITVGEKGENVDRHQDNPIVLQDLFIRVGGVHGGVASTDQAVVINANDVIGDDFWIWRADHGEGTGWDYNLANNGVVVNGDYVTLYGLMVEHFQEYDIIWRGEHGKTYFLQNEKCYDPKNQEEWMSHEGKVKGYAAYKVVDGVKNHYAVGLGSYDVFIYTEGASIFMDNSYEVPNADNVVIENCCTVEISDADGPATGNNSIINGVGPSISTGTGGGGYAIQAVTYYNNGTAIALPDWYERDGDQGDITEDDVDTIENVEAREEDPKAEEDSMLVPISSIYFKDVDKDYPLVVETDSTVQLELGFEPEAASGRVVRWSTKDPEIAKVDQNGAVTGVSNGKTTLTAKAGGKTAEITISVVDVAVKDIEILNKNEIENKGVKTGESKLLEARVLPADATEPDLLFKTDNPKYATVTAEGYIQGHTPGKVTITVTSESDQRIKETITFNVVESDPYIPANSIEIEEGPEIKIKVGGSKQLRAIVKPDDTTDRVAWDIEDAKDAQFASVSAEGVVTGHKAGEANIIARAGEQTATIKVIVEDENKIKSIDVPDKKNELFVGEDWKMKIEIDPENPLDELDFAASPADSVVIDRTGKVTARKAGTPTITISSKEDPSVNCKFSIRIIDFSSIMINDTDMTVGESRALNYSITPEVDIQEERRPQLFEFKSDNPGVLEVDEKGMLTARSAGTADITVIACNGIHDRRTITVSEVEVPQPIVTAVTAEKNTILIGQTTTAYATVSGSGSVTWNSSNEAAATVDANGTITGVGAGQTTISATIGNSTQSVVIQVVKPTVKWNFSYKTCPLQLKNGKKVNKTKAIQPTGVRVQEGDAVVAVKSSKTKIATVKLSKKGVLTITPKKVGKTKITVTTKYGAKATFTLKVQTGPVKVTSVSVNKAKVTLKKGQSFQIVATKKYITALDKVKYTTSNKKIATVSSKGKIKAKKKGKATITVKCGSKSKKIKVTVK